LSPAKVDVHFMVLAAMTMAASQFAVQLPSIGGRITVADTLVFLALLLYGREAAVVLAALEGLSSSLRISKKPGTVLFNSAVMSASIFMTAGALQLVFGPSLANYLRPFKGSLVAALCLMALVHYFVNSWLVSIDRSLKTGSSLTTTWREHYLWTSVTYFAGAAAAALIARLMMQFGFFPVILTTPVMAIVYFTYQTYMTSVQAAAAQAKQAEQYVEEQKRQILELEMTRKELHESREHFRNASLHDRLTGLPNRALFMDRLTMAVDRAKRTPDYLFAVLFVDLDRFKIVNDSQGHLAGDQLLIKVGERLKACLRPTDTVARLGGDEFALLLDDIAGFSSALTTAQRLLAEVSQPVVLESSEAFTTASIGIAFKSNDCEAETILRDADAAMYQAKQNGKARYEVFDNAMHSLTPYQAGQPRIMEDSANLTLAN